jgi:hypothetical protein
MTDPEETDPEKPDAVDERRVADFLSEFDDAPLPEEVVARLDTTLERLVAGRSQGTNVVALRPRRRWASALVAAATVSVVGVGVGTIWQQSERGTFGTNAADDAGKEVPEIASLDSGSPRVSGSVASPQAESGDLFGGYAAGGDSPVPAFTGAGFPDEVRTWLAGGGLEGVVWAPTYCPVPVSGGGAAFAATYDGSDAVVIVGDATNGERRVEIFRCGGDATALAATVVPAS